MKRAAAAAAATAATHHDHRRLLLCRRHQDSQQQQGLQSSICFQNSIMDFHIKSGSLTSAIRVFDCMSLRDSVSWNMIIHAHFHDSASFGLGFSLFSKARRVAAGFQPNISTLVLLIKACSLLGVTEPAFTLHAYLVRTGFLTVSSIQNALLAMYAHVSIKLATNLFDEMRHRDVISWTTMIGSYVHNHESTLALRLFLEMIYTYGIDADGQTMVSVLKASTHLGKLQMGQSLHAFVISKGLLHNDVFVGNSLVDFYSKCNDVDSAYKAFNEMPHRNVVSWNSLLSGYVHNHKHLEALMLFDSMGKAGLEADEVTFVNLLQICKHFINVLHCKSLHATVIRHGHESNELVINSLIDAYAKCNCVALSSKLFNKMQRRDAVTWTTMIAGFTHCGMPNEAISVCRQMMLSGKGLELNTVTMLNLLEACSLCADLKRAKLCHCIAIRRGLTADIAVGTAIVDAYSKSGAAEISRRVFDQIPHKNTVLWTAMIAAYGMNGFAQEALALLAEMKSQGVKPNQVTVLSVLCACSHGGLVEDGLSVFQEFVNDDDVELGIEHYSCLVDMLGRAGELDKAMDLIQNVADGRKLGASAWGALLSACNRYENFELGSNAVPYVIEMEPESSGGYLLGSNMYAAGGSWVDAAKMRRLVKERGVKVVGGYSLVHVDHKTCKFIAGERNHQHGSLHPVIQQLHSCMKKLKESNFDDTLI